MKLVTIIPAQLASIRLPRKILMPIQGIPMIEHVRRRAKLSKKINKVFVATGDLKIKKEVVSSILRKEMQIRGTWNSDFNSEKQDDWKMALSVMKEGLNPSELITREVSLEELPIVLEKLYFHKERKEEVQIIKAMVTTF